MSFSDSPLGGEIAASHAADLVGWRAEVGARICDFVVRKAVPTTERLGALVRAIEGLVSRASLKGALGDLLLYLRREKASTVASTEYEEFIHLLEARILEHRRRDSIENYGAYLFAVDVRL